MEYYIQDSQAEVLIYDEENRQKAEVLLENLGISGIFLGDLECPGQVCHDYEIENDQLDHDVGAVMVYTSGTTGRPKGVVHSVGSLMAQVDMLLKAWEWSSGDYILHCLPLHHVHGLVNCLLCSYHAGATCRFVDFGPGDGMLDEEVWGCGNVFMAVPTVYTKLLRAYRDGGEDVKMRWRDIVRNYRLCVSGSAALPITVFEEWKSLTDTPLLERYSQNLPNP